MNKKIEKIAVILFNLGGPDNLDAVKPFLFNLFYDKHITRLPNPIRFILSKMISSFREKKSKRIYQSIGGGSPLLKHTEYQAAELKRMLNDISSLSQFEIFIVMRYWHPFASDVIPKIKNYSPDQLVLLPLYPQFSTSTTLSSVTQFKEILSKHNISASVKTICCYPLNEGVIKGYTQLIMQQVHDFSNAIILFSAHNIPEKFVTDGDPYQWQIEVSVQAIIKELQKSRQDQGNELNWKITYQSKVGVLKWLKPDTKEEILAASIQQKDIVIIPISFVSEHVETKVELDIEYATIAQQYKVKYFRVASLGINKLFINGIANIVTNAVNKNGNTILSGNNESGVRLCPLKFTQCLCKEGNA